MTELLFLSWRHLGRGERICLAMLGATLVAWLVMPAIRQDPAYHAFADRRSLFGVANAADVLSSFAFVLVGFAGMARLTLGDRTQWSHATQASLWCVAIGLCGTSAGSAWYHANPNDATLVWDRLPMTVVFTGVMGAALAQRIGQNIARVAVALLFELGVLSVFYWHLTGDLSLYATLQFGGMAALLVLLLSSRRDDDPFRWWWLIGWYAVAKAFEFFDAAIWQMTNHSIAGHALKHVAAAIAVAALFMPHARLQNNRGSDGHPACRCNHTDARAIEDRERGLASRGGGYMPGRIKR